MGDGTSLNIKHIGQTVFQSPFNSKVSLKLNNLLHVPHITKNLISVSRFARDNSVFFEFHADSCYVKSQDSKESLLQGTLRSDGLYCFNDLAVNSHASQSHLLPSSVPPVVLSSVLSSSVNNTLAATCNLTNTQSTFHLWHSRLGHPSIPIVGNVLRYCNVRVPNRNISDFCTACCYGKMHKLPHPPSPHSYNTPLELIFMDVRGPSPAPSRCGSRYYLSFVDAYSRYTWIYPLTTKGASFDKFIEFKTLVENQFNCKIKAIQSDWGGEFRSFTNFLKTNGIVHRISCPYTHPQNGSVERKHRHIVELGLCLLAQASLPISFWVDAFLYVVHLINCLPTPVINYSSPYYCLRNTSPDYLFLRVFGCACFPLLRPYNNHKLDFRTTKCLFLGYSPHHKGYKCLSPNGRLYISRDVKFNELYFPYSSDFVSTSCHTSSPIILPSALPPVVNGQYAQLLTPCANSSSELVLDAGTSSHSSPSNTTTSTDAPAVIPASPSSFVPVFPSLSQSTTPTTTATSSPVTPISNTILTDPQSSLPQPKPKPKLQPTVINHPM